METLEKTGWKFMGSGQKRRGRVIHKMAEAREIEKNYLILRNILQSHQEKEAGTKRKGVGAAITVEPRFNEVPKDWGNWFVISGYFSVHFFFIECCYILFLTYSSTHLLYLHINTIFTHSFTYTYTDATITRKKLNTSLHLVTGKNK